jgi:hypothetical protein
VTEEKVSGVVWPLAIAAVSGNMAVTAITQLRAVNLIYPASLLQVSHWRPSHVRNQKI